MKIRIIFLLGILLFGIKNFGQTTCIPNPEMYGYDLYSTQVLDNGAVRIGSAGIKDYISWGDLSTTSTRTIDAEFYHIYETNGSYPIQFTYYDIQRNCTTLVDTTVIISTAINNPCAAIFTSRSFLGDQWVFTPYNVTYPFVGSEMHWDFDNGTNHDSIGRQIQNYPVEGDYNVCLTQTNSLIGCSSTYCDSLHISYHDGYHCGVELVVEQEDNFVKITYAPEDSVGNLALTGIDYGDGIPSDGQLTHRYLSPGSYTITLFFDNTISPWMCDTTVTQNVTVSSIVGPPCDAGIHTFEYYPRGTYLFENPQTLYYGASYQQSWNFGAGWINIGSSSYILNTFDSVGTYNVCNAIYVAETGCTDTVCGNYYIDHSALQEVCDIYGDYSLVYKDASVAFVVIDRQVTPEFAVPYIVTVAGGVPIGVGGSHSGYSEIVEIDPSITHAVHMQITPYDCTDSHDFIIDVTADPMMPCDSMVLGVDVIDMGNGNFEIKPILHASLGTNYELFTATYNLNGYSFEADLKSVFVQMPFSGEFSGWVEFTDPNMQLFCSPSLKYYFNIDNSSSPNPSICDAYFELIEDTANIVPHTWFCNNASSGNNLSFLWDFGDGGFSDSILPYHMYATPGYYEVSLTITDTISGCTDTYFSDARSGSELILQIIPGTNSIGIEEELSHNIQMFPNPANEFIQVSINNAAFDELILNDITGRFVAGYTNEIILPLSDLNTGIYFITGKYQGKYYTLKLMKL